MINIDNLKVIILFSIIFLIIIFLPFILNFVNRNKSSGNFFENYYLANRKVSGIILAITLMSTYGSASTFLAGPGISYKLGLGWVLLAVIQVTAGYFVLLVLARKFKKISQKINSITITDYLKHRYKSNFLSSVCAISMVLFLLSAMSGQWIGGGKLLSALLGIEYKTGVFIISLIIILCVVIGGLRSILISDMLQGLIMIFSTIILFVYLLKYSGGMEIITDNLFNQNPNLLTPYGSTGKLTSIYVSSFWVLIGVGLVGLPQIAINSMIYKNARSLKQSIIIGTIVIFIVMFGVHLIGVMARGIIFDINDYDSVIPIIAKKVLPWYFVSIVLAAPMCAIITTVNTQFLLISSTLVKDFVFNIKYIKLFIKDKKIPIIVYSINLIIIIIATIISLNPSQLIVEINLFALGGLEATFLWPIILGIYWKNAEKYGALSSTMLGVFSYVLLKKIYKISFIEPVVISLTLSFIVFVVVSKIVNKNKKLMEEL